LIDAATNAKASGSNPLVTWSHAPRVQSGPAKVLQPCPCAARVQRAPPALSPPMGTPRETRRSTRPDSVETSAPAASPPHERACHPSHLVISLPQEPQEVLHLGSPQFSLRRAEQQQRPPAMTDGGLIGRRKVATCGVRVITNSQSGTPHRWPLQNDCRLMLWFLHSSFSQCRTGTRGKKIRAGRKLRGIPNAGLFVRRHPEKNKIPKLSRHPTTHTPTHTHTHTHTHIYGSRDLPGGSEGRGEAESAEEISFTK